MGYKLEDAAKKQPQSPVPPLQKQRTVFSSPKDPVLLEESTERRPHLHHQPSPLAVPIGGASPSISAAPDLYVPSGAILSSFEQQLRL